MKALNHTGFSSTLKHEFDASRDGRVKSMNKQLNKQIRGYSIKHANRMKETIGNGGLYKFKKHIEAGVTCIP